MPALVDIVTTQSMITRSLSIDFSVVDSVCFCSTSRMISVEAIQPEEQRRAKGTSWKSVYDDLRRRILTLELSPGEMLDESTLADRYGVSRSPVREALIRLAGEELVVTLPNRSTIVAPLAIERFPKYVEALDIAQRMNCRLAAELRSDEDIEILLRRQNEYEQAVRDQDHLAMSGTNAAFHKAIGDAGRNPHLAAFYSRLLDQGRRILHLHFRYLERGGPGVLLTDEHYQMIDAIRDRDVARADQLAHAHTRQFSNNFMNFMQEHHLTGELV
jgi:DNA-binding GntR family transcriptional regulator